MEGSEEPTVEEISLQIENIRSAEVQLRVDAVKHLVTIAVALGPERTRNELVPYLSSSIDDEDEFLLELANQLLNFVPMIGGFEHAHCLLGMYERLMAAEEASIREKAVAGLNNISASLPEPFLYRYFIPLLDSLVQERWYTVRSASCGLFASVYPRVNVEARSLLRKAFRDLCVDTTPMVRRAAADALRSFLQVIEPASVQAEFCDVYSTFSSDEQDTVRVACVSVSPTMASLVTPAIVDSLIIPMYRKASEDSSWRVRYMASETITSLQVSVAGEVVADHLLPIMVTLMTDTEAEVRAAISKRVGEFCRTLPMAIRNDAILLAILPKSKTLVEDPSEYVRAAIASVIMGLAVLIGRENTIQHLLPLFLTLLKDPCSEVRLNVISHLEDVNKVIGISQLAQSLLPAIHALAEDPVWRVRLAIIEYIPLVSRQLGVEFFNTELCGLCINWLRDQVFSVRKAASDNLRNIVVSFGFPWAKTVLLPLLVELSRDGKFVTRLTTIFAINSIIEIGGDDSLFVDFVGIVCSLASDPVPNIRFNAALTLQKLLALTPKDMHAAKIQPVLEALCGDKDPDVGFFSNRALYALSATYC